MVLFLVTFFIFLVLRPPPRSTLFPYTTLFRSNAATIYDHTLYYVVVPSSGFVSALDIQADRSEEHTSELQSQSNLVCRLLLEKKKKKKTCMFKFFDLINIINKIVVEHVYSFIL